MSSEAPSVQENGTWGRVRGWYKKGKKLYQQGKEKWEEYDKKYKLKTRYEGWEKVKSGAAFGALAVPVCGTSPTGIGAIACGGLVYKSADDISAGTMQMVTGEEVPTHLETVAKNTTKALGGSDKLADSVAKGTQAPEQLITSRSPMAATSRYGLGPQSGTEKVPVSGSLPSDQVAVNEPAMASFATAVSVACSPCRSGSACPPGFTLM